MRTVLIHVLLAAAICAVYWPVHHFPFVNYDDETYLYENKHVLEGMSAHNFAWAFQTFEAANYHPLTWVSWLIDSSLFKMKPGAFHVENVFFHIAATLLLFEMFRRSTGQIWPSAFVAAIFGLHPAHVESVAWASERKDVLSTALMVLAMLFYLRYTRAGSPRRRAILYLTMFLCFALGLLAKPMIVTFPFLLILLDYWPLNRMGGLHWTGELKEKSPMFLLSILSCIVTYKAQHQSGAVVGLVHISVLMRFNTVLTSYVLYIAKSFVPINLSPYYPYHKDWSASAVIGSAALLLVLSAFFIRLARRRPYVLMGWLWFLGTLVPVIGIIQAGDQSIADRYLYVPMTGLAIIVAWAGVEAARFSRTAVATLAAAILIAAGITARHQLNFWRDTRTLFTHASQVINGNAVAYVQLGYLDAREGHTAAALDEYEEAIRLDPTNYVPKYDAGNLLLKIQPQESLDFYRQAAEDNPASAKIQNNWGNALIDLHNPGEAYEHFHAAVQLDPDFAEAHLNLARLLMESGYISLARREIQIALELEPNSPEAKKLLNALQSQSGAR